MNDLQVHNRLVHQEGKLYPRGKEQPCVICQARGQRNPLQPVDSNQSIRKPRTTRTARGCVQCNISLCSKCCKEHLQAANRIASEDAANSTDSEDSGF